MDTGKDELFECEKLAFAPLPLKNIVVENVSSDGSKTDSCFAESNTISSEVDNIAEAYGNGKRNNSDNLNSL